jgi:hypothetical protein
MVSGTPRRWYALCLLAVAVTAVLAGCGSGSSEPSSDAPQGEEQEAAEAAKQIPEADRVAYYQLATTAGLLRIRAVAALKGNPRPASVGPVELRAASRRVAATAPEDKGLRLSRGEVLDLLSLERDTSLSRLEAHVVLDRLDTLHRVLDRYVRKRQPEQAGLLPD